MANLYMLEVRKKQKEAQLPPHTQVEVVKLDLKEEKKKDPNIFSCMDITGDDGEESDSHTGELYWLAVTQATCWTLLTDPSLPQIRSKQELWQEWGQKGKKKRNRMWKSTKRDTFSKTSPYIPKRGWCLLAVKILLFCYEFHQLVFQRPEQPTQMMTPISAAANKRLYKEGVLFSSESSASWNWKHDIPTSSTSQFYQKPNWIVAPKH